MNTKTTCCGSTTASSCESTIAELPRYYPRQLITPDDLTLEQDYFRDRMRRHNRLLHGWGVVCGALVCPVTSTDANNVVTLTPWLVQVQPGYALGPYGDEIIIDCARTVPLRGNGVSGATGDPCVDVPDPWCSQVTVPRTAGTLYIAVKYKQSMTRPVRVQPIGCGCNDNTCECSRWHDGYEIGVLTCCPDDKVKLPQWANLFPGDIPDCPACPPQPWVVLAAVTVDANGVITSIDNCQCRRLVASLAGFWWQCKENDITIEAIDQPTVFIGQTAPVTISGTNLAQEDTYSLGNGIMVTPTASAPDGTSVTLSVNVNNNVQPGPRTLVVIDSQCRMAMSPIPIKVDNEPTTTTGGKGQVVEPAAPAKEIKSKSAKKQTNPTAGSNG